MKEAMFEYLFEDKIGAPAGNGFGIIARFYDSIDIGDFDAVDEFHCKDFLGSEVSVYLWHVDGLVCLKVPAKPANMRSFYGEVNFFLETPFNFSDYAHGIYYVHPVEMFLQQSSQMKHYFHINFYNLF